MSGKAPGTVQIDRYILGQAIGAGKEIKIKLMDLGRPSWQAISYTITFDANGGSNTPASMKISYGSKYGTLGTVTREEYTFLGWYTAKKGGTKITADTVYNGTANQTLYAHWKYNGFTVTWNEGTGYTIKVERKTSQQPGESIGELSNGAPIFKNDVLYITYIAHDGYVITSKGNAIVAVSGDVTSSAIYAEVYKTD